jgi:PhnB protein
MIMPEEKSIPDGMHSVTPHLVYNGTSDSITLYKNAFGAEEITLMLAPNRNEVLHAKINVKILL